MVRWQIHKSCAVCDWSCLLARRWSASWLWSANVTASAARAAFGPAGWPCPTSGALATTFARGTTAPCRWPSTSMALGSLQRTHTSNDPARTTWCTLRTRRTTAYGTTSQVSTCQVFSLFLLVLKPSSECSHITLSLEMMTESDCRWIWSCV